MVSVGLMAQAPDPLVGTWKINLAKSTFSPGPAPKSQTLTITVAGQGMKVNVQGVDGQGKPTSTQYTANYDGKDYPVTITGAAAADYDHVVLKRIDARTSETTRKKTGKVVQTVRRVVSQDGKTLTTTATGMNAQGQKVNNVTVYDKQ